MTPMFGIVSNGQVVEDGFETRLGAEEDLADLDQSAAPYGGPPYYVVPICPVCSALWGECDHRGEEEETL